MPSNESEPLWDPEGHRERVFSRGRQLRRRRGAAKVVGVVGGVVVLFGALALVAWPHSTTRIAVVAGPARGVSTTVSSAASGGNFGAAQPPSPSPATSGPPAPDDGRLHRAYVPVGYHPGDGSLSSYRVDPAPGQIQPGLSQAEALRAFEATDAASLTHQAGTTVIVRFGLFTGSVSNPPAPDHTLTGTHQVQEQPAWLVLVDGVRFSPSGGGGAGPPVIPGESPGVAPTAPTTVTTTAAADKVVTGYAVAVITDPEGRLLTGLTITGGSVAELGVN